MSRWIKQNSSNTSILFGPTLLSSDGVTPSTGFAHTVYLSKAGAAAATMASTSTGTPSVGGWYTFLLSSADTATVGGLTALANNTTHLPIWHEFMVLPANAYDSLVGGTDTLEVDVIAWVGTTASTSMSAPTTAPANFSLLSISTAGRTSANVTQWAGETATTAMTAPTTAPANFSLTSISTAGRASVDVTMWAAQLTTAGNLALSTQAAPSNWALSSITTGGRYSADALAWAGVATTSGNVALSTQAFPSNFANTVISTGGRVEADAVAISASTAAADGVEAKIAFLDVSVAGRASSTALATNFQYLTISTGGVASADAVAISGDSVAADRLEALMDGIIVGQVNSTTGTTTVFTADGFTEGTDDHFNGRLITFLTGVLTGQQTAIADYAGASQQFTVTALTEAPVNDMFFVIH